MHKGELIEDVLKRIAIKEVGIKIDTKQKHLIDQFVGKFSTEHHRQDISTGYYIKVDSTQPININEEHFTQFQVISTLEQIPSSTGAMYRHYLQEFFQNHKGA